MPEVGVLALVPDTWGGPWQPRHHVLTRLAKIFPVVWVNPLKGSPRYEPLARGMAAAMPSVDVFLSGHNLESLEHLGRVLGA